MTQLDRIEEKLDRLNWRLDLLFGPEKPDQKPTRKERLRINANVMLAKDLRKHA